MNRFAMIFAVAAVGLSAASADAQWVTTYYRAPTTAYYAPTTAYYAPATTAYFAPTPYTTYYAPTPRAAYYAPAPVYAPAYRPLVGGITRVRYRYAPVVYAPPATVVGYPAW